ncbi:hypothetical protein DMN91_006205, partial [Ooceraea biroi]
NLVFRELTSTSKNFDDASSKIRNVTSQQSADVLVFFAICGVFFAFMILSASTPKNQVSSYDTSNIETISTAFEEDPSWYSSSSSTNSMNCFHACGDSIGSSRDIVSGVQDLPCPPVCENRISPRSGTSSHNVRHSSHSQNLKKRRLNHLVSQTIPQEWLIRRTRSGHIYGKYPTQEE